MAERRRQARLRPSSTAWADAALLRPGQEVTIIDVSHRGALLESTSRMSPGAHVALQLTGRHRLMIRGRILRCEVVRLEPLTYRGALMFDEHLELFSAAVDTAAASVFALRS